MLTAGNADLAFDGKAGNGWVKAWNSAYQSRFGPAVAAAKMTYAAPPPSPFISPAARRLCGPVHH